MPVAALVCPWDRPCTGGELQPHSGCTPSQSQRQTHFSLLWVVIVPMVIGLGFIAFSPYTSFSGNHPSHVYCEGLKSPLLFLFSERFNNPVSKLCFLLLHLLSPPSLPHIFLYEVICKKRVLTEPRRSILQSTLKSSTYLYPLR